MVGFVISCPYIYTTGLFELCLRKCVNNLYNNTDVTDVMKYPTLYKTLFIMLFVVHTPSRSTTSQSNVLSV